MCSKIIKHRLRGEDSRRVKRLCEYNRCFNSIVLKQSSSIFYLYLLNSNGLEFCCSEKLKNQTDMLSQATTLINLLLVICLAKQVFEKIRQLCKHGKAGCRRKLYGSISSRINVSIQQAH